MTGGFHKHVFKANIDRMTVLALVIFLVQVITILARQIGNTPSTGPFAAFQWVSLAYACCSLAFLPYSSAVSHGRIKEKTRSIGPYLFLGVFLIFEVAMEAFELIIFASIFRSFTFIMVFALVPLIPRIATTVYMTIYYACMILLITLVGTPDGTNYIFITVFTLCGLLFSFLTYSSHSNSYVTYLKMLKANENLTELNNELELLSITDPLTRISNRRAFDEYLPVAWNLCCRSGDYMAVLMLDIDYFKLYNDTFGHQQGDFCLQSIAACIKGFVRRNNDMLARYGGEEFSVLLPSTREKDALAIAESIRSAVEDLALPHPASTAGDSVTISIGVACQKADETSTASDLVRASDHALYRAKQEGRNRVVADFEKTSAGFPSADSAKAPARELDSCSAQDAWARNVHAEDPEALNGAIAALIEGRADRLSLELRLSGERGESSDPAGLILRIDAKQICATDRAKNEVP